MAPSQSPATYDRIQEETEKLRDQVLDNFATKHGWARDARYSRIIRKKRNLKKGANNSGTKNKEMAPEPSEPEEDTQTGSTAIFATMPHFRPSNQPRPVISQQRGQSQSSYLMKYFVRASSPNTLSGPATYVTKNKAPVDEVPVDPCCQIMFTLSEALPIYEALRQAGYSLPAQQRLSLDWVF